MEKERLSCVLKDFYLCLVFLRMIIIRKIILGDSYLNGILNEIKNYGLFYIRSIDLDL